MAVAAAGPVPFVAMAAPRLARRITRPAGPNVPSAGEAGTLRVTVADLATQRLAGSGLYRPACDPADAGPERRRLLGVLGDRLRALPPSAAAPAHPAGRGPRTHNRRDRTGGPRVRTVQ
ncbi:hypothetical protein SHO565_77280 [Streptomyces sp. HO565]